MDKFLVWHKTFGPAQNILGPVKGQGITIQRNMGSRPVRTSSAYSISLLSEGKESNFEELMVTSNEVTGIPTMAGDGPKQLKRKQDAISDNDHTGKSLSEVLIFWIN